jgi:hypothetical protein
MELVDNWLISIANKIRNLSRCNIPLNQQLDTYQNILESELARVKAMREIWKESKGE